MLDSIWLTIINKVWFLSLRKVKLLPLCDSCELSKSLTWNYFILCSNWVFLGWQAGNQTEVYWCLFLKVKTQKDGDGVKNDSTITKIQITKWSFDIMYLLLMEKYSGNLISYYYFSLWTNHGICQLINGVYLHMLVMFTHKTGNCKLKLSRIHRQIVLVSKSQTLREANFLSYDGLQRL